MIYTESELQGHIYEIQKYLHEVSKNNKNIPPLVINGIFDEDTSNSVSAFQQEYGIENTGTANEQTWKTLSSVHNHFRNKNTLSVHLFPYDKLIYPGENSAEIYVLQHMFNSINKYFNQLPSPEITGIYDSLTLEAVEMLQKISLLPVNGIIDKYLWNVSVILYEQFPA